MATLFGFNRNENFILFQYFYCGNIYLTKRIFSPDILYCQKDPHFGNPSEGFSTQEIL